jgi:hypothetical protein
MTVLVYVVAALTDPSLCLQAALALRNLCDANRKALAPQIGAFAELYAGLGSVPVRLSISALFYVDVMSTWLLMCLGRIRRGAR